MEDGTIGFKKIGGAKGWWLVAPYAQMLFGGVQVIFEGFEGYVKRMRLSMLVFVMVLIVSSIIIVWGPDFFERH